MDRVLFCGFVREAGRRRTAARFAERPRPRTIHVLEALEPRTLLTVSLSISDATLTEGNVGTVDMSFTVSRTGSVSPPVYVAYRTMNGLATGAHHNFVPRHGTTIIPAGARTGTISIPVIGDTIYGSTETFVLSLTGGYTGLASSQDLPAGATPQSVAVGDLDGDGRADLAVANYSANTVSVLINLTAGGAETAATFATRREFPVGAGPFSIAIGDLNADGRSDLVIANSRSGSIAVLLNTTSAGAASPSFTTMQEFAVGLNPVSVTIGDLNGDGRPDLAVANADSNTVSVLLNTTAPESPTAAFANAQDFPVGTAPYSVAIGDLNADGGADLAVANMRSDSVSVLLNTTPANQTTASFTPAQDFAVGGYPYALTIGDLNDDGWGDLAVANMRSDTVSVLVNTTPAGGALATFLRAKDCPVGHQPYSVAIADLSGDGLPDLAVANKWFGTVSVLLNTTTEPAASPTFNVRQDAAVGLSPYALAAADLNADGRLDLAIANRNSGSVSVLLNSPVVITRPDATGTILDDDPMPSVFFTTADRTVFDNAGTITVAAELSAPSSLDTVVPFTVSGTATGGGVDYSISPSPIVIPAGSTTATISISLVADAASAHDKTIVLAMGTPTNATLGGTTVSTVIIIYDDKPPTVQFGFRGQSADESSGMAIIRILLSAKTLRDVIVPFTVGGTATPDGIDYSITPSPVIIPAGSTTGYIAVNLVDDTIAEPTELIVLSLGEPTNATLGDTRVHTVYMVDNEPARLSISDASVIEGDEGSTAILFTVTRLGNLAAPVSVSYRTLDGTATTAGNDYVPRLGLLAIPAGNSSGAISILVNGDTAFEPNETFYVELYHASNAAIDRARGAGTIRNADPLLGTPGPDVFYLRSNNTHTAAEVYLNPSMLPPVGPPTYTLPGNDFDSLAIDGSGGDDTFVADFADGDPVPPGGLSIDGGDGDNTLTILGTPEADSIVADDGQLRFASTRITTSNIQTVELDARGGPDNVIVNAGRLRFASSQNLSSLAIANGATVSVAAGGDKVLQTSQLAIAPGARLDLFDNDLIVHATPSTRQSVLADVAAWIAAARHSPGKQWQGPGITSTAARDNAMTGLAITLNDKGGTDGPILTHFSGQDVDVNDILVKYTWNGDMNLDGVVNADDWFLIDSGFIARTSGYRNGDLNYDGVVNADDYFMIDTAFLGQTGMLSTAEPAPSAADELYIISLPRKQTTRDVMTSRLFSPTPLL